MTEDSGPSGTVESCSKTESRPDSLSSQRVFKKSSPNNKLTLYLSSRDLVVSSGKIDRLQGVLLVDPEFVEQRKVYGQVTLTFRYGREDEEVMGLKFCNEAVMCLAQLYPPHAGSQPPEANTPLQDALLRRLGPNAYPFTMEITPLAPPSVQLVPAKEYNGAPIGTSYDVRAYVADRADEKLHRRTTVRMGIRVVQRAFAPPSPYLYSPGGQSLSPKDRNKHKITLFGSKSTTLETKSLTYSPTQRPKPLDVQEEMNRMNERGKKPPEIITNSPSILKKNDGNGNNGVRDLSDRVEGYIDENISEGRTPTHVTFKEQLTNGLEDDREGCSDVISGRKQVGDVDEENGEIPTKLVTEQSDLVCSDNESGQMEHIRPPCGGKRPSLAAFLAEVPAPHAVVEKPFLLSDGRIELESFLNKAIFYHGEEVQITVSIRNNSNKTIRRIKVFVVQHVDVCMFSNGKFKNVVAMINTKDDCPISSGTAMERTYNLIPTKSSTKNWIALEDSYTKSGTSLASSVMSASNNPDERNVFAIYVSYYVKVKLLVSVMGGEVSLKLPFTLMHTCNDFDSSGTLSKLAEEPKIVQRRKSIVEEVKPEKDGT